MKTAPHSSLILALLATAAFSLAISIDPWSSALRNDRSGSLLALLLGDGRRLFANHFFAKADAYFHRGVYPTIFDPPRKEELHMVSEGQATSAEEPEHDEEHHHDEAAHSETNSPTVDHPEHLQSVPPEKTPLDWIARWNLHFSPNEHSHLSGADTREMLPWLKLSAELDPNNVQNFTVTAYWLRGQLNRPDEAEQLLRDGLRYNPGSPEILLELGLLYLQTRKDPIHARNILELALHAWERRPRAEDEANRLLGESILVRLANLEEAAGNLTQSLAYLRTLRTLSPNPTAIDALIRDVEAKIKPSTPPR